MAQQCRIWHSIGQRCLKGIDVINALTGIGSFAEKILIYVGYHRRIGINTIHAGEDTLEQ